MGEFEDCSTEQGNPTECDRSDSENDAKEEIENTNSERDCRRDCFADV
ncbi:hypothetical protein AGMMS49975_21890 [Clostridia bacterium]|nr:hypothetical protein AGMMS49975_21890 [Clostridia bacterium]